MKYIDSINKQNYFSKIDWSEIKIPRYWYKNEPVITHIMNAISLITPEIERCIVISVRSYEEFILDETLLKKTKDFLLEEYTHSLQHIRFNEDLKRHGYPVDFIMKFLRKGFTWMQKFGSQEMKLAHSVCFEHMACSLGRTILEKEIFTGNTSVIFDLFTWHSFEESIHRDFLLDFYYALGGGYLRRIIAYMVTSLCLQFMMYVVVFLLLITDAVHGKQAKLRNYMAAIKLTWHLKKGYKYYFNCYRVYVKFEAINTIDRS